MTAPGGDAGVVILDATGPEDGSPSIYDGGLLPTVFDAEAGGPCEASSDCPPDLLCMYPLSEGCSATGVCTVLAASKCAGPFCTCRGDTTAACGDFGQLPMELPLHGIPLWSTR